MKHLKLFESYSEGKNSYVTHNGIDYDLDKILKIARKKKSTIIETSKLKWILKHDKLSKRRVKLADTKFPLIVVKEKGKHVVLDGVHRLTKALENDVKSLPVKLITKKELAKCKRTKLNEELTDFTKDIFNIREGYLICMEEIPQPINNKENIIYNYIFVITTSETLAKREIIKNWLFDDANHFDPEYWVKIYDDFSHLPWPDIITKLDGIHRFPITDEPVKFNWGITGLEPRPRYNDGRSWIRHYSNFDRDVDRAQAIMHAKGLSHWLNEYFTNPVELLKINGKLQENEHINPFTKDLFGIETMIALEFDIFPNVERCNKIYMSFIGSLNLLGIEASPTPVEDNIGAYRLISIAGKYNVSSLLSVFPTLPHEIQNRSSRCFGVCKIVDKEIGNYNCILWNSKVGFFNAPASRLNV